MQDIWLFYLILANNMEIILLESHNKLGKAGDIVSVKDGYARNYLIPTKKAIIANKNNKMTLDTRMSQIEKINKKRTSEANDIKSKINNQVVQIETEANEDGNLYGNLNPKQVTEAIEKKLNVKLSSDSINLGLIKNLGSHEININLYDNISAVLNLELIKKI